MAMTNNPNNGQMAKLSNMLGVQQDYSPNMVKRATAFESAQETFGAAHRLSDRVMGIVNRIAGHVPQDAAKEGMAAPVANGVLDELRDGASSAHSAMSRANEALDRLERELG